MLRFVARYEISSEPTLSVDTELNRPRHGLPLLSQVVCGNVKQEESRTVNRYEPTENITHTEKFQGVEHARRSP